ncbi:MAG: lipase family protein, partial [Holosporaceae bacterium]
QEAKWRVTGHSLGGALAQLMAYYLQHKGLAVEWVTTFGTFQMFDAPSAAWYDEKLKACTYTIIQENDPVSMVGALDWVNALYIVQALYKSYHTPDALLEISNLLAQVSQPLSSSCHVGQITVLPSQLIPHRMQTFIDHYSHEENDLKEGRPLKRSQAPQTAYAEHYTQKAFVYTLAKANCHPFINPAKQAQLSAPLICPIACG